MTTILAWTVAIQRAATQWDDQAEQLHGARTTLAAADPSLLGDRVAGAARAFLVTWGREVDRLLTEAEDHATALRGAASDIDLADMSGQAEMRRLMSWDDHCVPAPGGAP